MSALVTYLIAGLATGASFALIGSGFVVVHRVTGVINFAQGTAAVVGGLAASSFVGMAIPHGAAELLAILAGGLLGLLVGVIAIGKPGIETLNSLLITLGLAGAAYALEILIWGENPLSFTMLGGHVRVLGASLQSQYFLIMGVTVVTFVLLELFFSRSYLGKGLTACSLNPYAARIVGIDVTRMGLIAFTIGGVLGALAGVLTAPLQGVSYSSDVTLGLNGFSAAILGGLMSPALALAGGLLLGVAESLVSGYISGADQTEVALALMLLVMIWRARAYTAISQEMP